MMWILGAGAWVACCAAAAEDIYAKPAYRLTFPEAPISPDMLGELQGHDMIYRIMKMKNETYLCKIPLSNSSDSDNSSSEPETDDLAELDRARARGWDLLRPLEGECMYYISGWWTYAFCHNDYVKQFHQAVAPNGSPRYPPTEDPTTGSYFLGRKKAQQNKNRKGTDPDVYGGGSQDDPSVLPPKDVLQISKHKNLVHRFKSGSYCELINQPREIEIQFQCNPASGDRVAWVKELSTCRYVMVVWTPRLCYDLVFGSVREEEQETAKEIECRLVRDDSSDSTTPQLPEQQEEKKVAPPITTQTRVRDNYVMKYDSSDPDENELQQQEEDDRRFREVFEPTLMENLNDASLMLVPELQSELDQGALIRPDTGEPAGPDDDFNLEIEIVSEDGGSVLGKVEFRIREGVVSVAKHNVMGSSSPEERAKGRKAIPRRLLDELHSFVSGDETEDGNKQQQQHQPREEL